MSGDPPDRPPETPPTVAALLAGPADDRALFVGADRRGDHGLTVPDLRRIARAAARRLRPGDGVLLARPPGTAEAPLAGLLFGLLAADVRVFLPATLHGDMQRHLTLFDPTAIVCDRRTVPGCEADGDAFARRLERLGRDRGVPLLDLSELLAGWIAWQTPSDGTVDGIDDISRGMNGISDGISNGIDGIDGIDGISDPLARRRPRADILCLSTSGSTGAPRVVRYHEARLMATIDAHRRAGLLDPALLGGPTACPGLCHSMGVRAALLALATRQPIVFVQPEWPRLAPGELARLLLAHPPRHFTAGPALLGALPALADAEPGLRRVLSGLAVLVSSGAAFDPRLPARLPGVRLANAFGTSETQQVLTTLLDPDAPLDTLGRALPGVDIRILDGQLHIRSPFGADGLLGEPDWTDGYAPGDRVVRDADGRLRHAGRDDDIISTGLGVELARGPIEARLSALPDVQRCAVFAHPECPGLLGLAFVGDRDPAAIGPRLRDALLALAERSPPRAPFEADRIWAVGLLPGSPPLRGPGKIDRPGIAAAHGALLDRLAAGDAAAGLLLVDPLDGPAPDPAWPDRAPARAAVGLDIEVVGGRGDDLDVEQEGRRFEVLDLVGGFGANLLGHRHPAVHAAARDALDGIPLCDQGARRAAESALCGRLSALLARETGRPYAVALANTGAEAVDLALRHALARRAATIEAHHAHLKARFGARAPEAVRAVIEANRATLAHHPPTVVALDGTFVGLGLASRLACGPGPRRDLVAPLLACRAARVSRAVAPAELVPLEADRLPLCTLVDDDGGPTRAPWRPSNLLAVIAEPVQGEGGVHPIDPAALHRLATLDAPLILDQIQVGLGRCGPLICAPDVPAEVILLGKALGGGVAKISAVAIHRRHRTAGFDAHRGSTFAGDTLGCRVALTVLDLVESERVSARATALGERLSARLRALADRWPTVVRDVRGQGLLHGLELAPPSAADPITRALAARGWGLIAASWLLARHRVRVLPTLAAPRVLRIQPSVTLTEAQLDRVEAAFEGLCAALATGDLAELVGHWAGLPAAPAGPSQHPATAIEAAPPTAAPIRVAFVHPLHAPTRGVVRVAPSLERLGASDRQRLVRRILAVLPGAPLPVFEHRLEEGRIALDGIAVCAPPAAFEMLRRRGRPEPLRRAVDAALALARERGAQVAVLGGQTSAITDAGRALLPPAGLRVVTGNTFTVAAALAGLRARVRRAGLDPDDPGLRWAVLGAAGNIGRALARGLLDDGIGVGPVTLVGRRGSRARLQDVRDRLRPSAAGRPLHVADDASALRQADVILAAVGDARPLDARHLAADRPVLLLDLSVPSVVPAGLSATHARLRSLRVGRIRLPRDPQLRLGGVGRPGRLFACAAEGVLLALEPTLGGPFVGPIGVHAIAALTAAGRRWGYLDDPPG